MLSIYEIAEPNLTSYLRISVSNARNEMMVPGSSAGAGVHISYDMSSM